MKEECHNSVRFEKLHLQNYGCFHGVHDFVFDRERTLIVGNGGTGKTIIANALANLGPVPGVKPPVRARPPEMSAIVSTSGDRELVRKYKRIMFLGDAAMYENPDLVAAFAALVPDQHQEMLLDAASIIFKTLVSRKLGMRDGRRDLNPAGLASGERVCLVYAYAFAARKILDLDLPLVFDRPYGMVNEKIRDSLRVFIQQQKCQQILLLSEFECGDERAHYRLEFYP